jgi:hypothetical protein
MMTGVLSILAALSLAEAGALAPGQDQVIAVRPPLSICQALETAERYASEKGIDLSGQYVHSVQLLYDAERGALCWRIQWMWSRPALGGEFGLKVYFDGRIEEDWLGP